MDAVLDRAKGLERLPRGIGRECWKQWKLALVAVF
jgi:hypothetical protein